MTSKSEDDFWNASTSSAFNFDDDEDSSELFQNFTGQSTITKSPSVLPIQSIISESSLNMILDDISSTLEYVVPSVEEAIKKAFNGHKHIFEGFKRLSDKIKLLDAAIETLDGDIILNVILFLKSSLRPNIFFQQLSKRKLAVKHYSYHLILNSQFQELTDLYMATGNSTNLKQVYYLIGKDIMNKSLLCKRLKQFSVENLNTINNHDEKMEIQDSLQFLEWQLEKNQTANTVIEQLALLCQHEWQKNKNSNDAILEFKKLLKIDDMSFEWTVLNILASMQLWPQLTSMFVKPNWFNKKNVLKTAISQEMFVYGLSRHKPPKDILEQYLNCMQDSEKSMSLAHKLGCHKFIIQQYINQRDRLALIGYKARLTSHDEEYFLVENALQSSDKKWKN